MKITAHQWSEAVSSPPGLAAPFLSGDTSWAQKDYAGIAWTRVVYSTFLLLPLPSLQTSPTCRQQKHTESTRWGIHHCFLWAVSSAHHQQSWRLCWWCPLLRGLSFQTWHCMNVKQGSLTDEQCTIQWWGTVLLFVGQHTQFLESEISWGDDLCNLCSKFF